MHQNNSLDNIICNLNDARKTLNKQTDFKEMVKLACFISLIEPKSVIDALDDNYGLIRCMKCLNNFFRAIGQTERVGQTLVVVLLLETLKNMQKIFLSGTHQSEIHFQKATRRRGRNMWLRIFLICMFRRTIFAKKETSLDYPFFRRSTLPHRS